MCKATRYDSSNRYRTRGQLCRLRLAIIWGVHIKQVDEVKGDARKKWSIVVLELSKLLSSGFFIFDRSIRGPATMVKSQSVPRDSMQW